MVCLPSRPSLFGSRFEAKQPFLCFAADLFRSRSFPKRYQTAVFTVYEPDVMPLVLVQIPTHAWDYLGKKTLVPFLVSCAISPRWALVGPFNLPKSIRWDG